MPSPVLIDVDGTLADFARPFHRIVGRTYNPDAHHSWEFDDLIGNELATAWRHVATTPWWWWALPPLTDCFPRIDALTKKRPVYFVTAREVGTPDVLFQTASWLRCMGIENPCVIRTEKKGKLASLLNAGWLLDDNPEHVISAGLYNPGMIQGRLLRRSYNGGSALLRENEMVDSIEDFLKEVECGV